MSLTVGSKRVPEQENVREQRVAVRFLVQGPLVLRGQGPFAGQEQRAVFVGEIVVQFGAQAKIDGRRGGQRMDLDREETGAFGLPFHLHQATRREFLEDAFERRYGDMGQTGEVFIAALVQELNWGDKDVLWSTL